MSMFTAAFLSRSFTIPQCRQRYTRSFNPIGGLAISPHSEQVCVVYAGLTGMNLRPFLTACQCSIWMSVAMAASWAFRAMLVFYWNFGLMSSLAMMSLRSLKWFAHVWAMVSRCAAMRRQSLRYCALAFL